MHNFDVQVRAVNSFYKTSFPLAYKNLLKKKGLNTFVSYVVCCQSVTELLISLEKADDVTQELLLEFKITLKYLLISIGLNNQLLYASRFRACLDVLVQIMYHHITKEPLEETHRISFRNSKDMMSNSIIIHQVNGKDVYALYSNYSKQIHGSTGFQEFAIGQLTDSFSKHSLTFQKETKNLKIILSFLVRGIPIMMDLKDKDYTVAQTTIMRHAFTLL